MIGSGNCTPGCQVGGRILGAGPGCRPAPSDAAKCVEIRHNARFLTRCRDHRSYFKLAGLRQRGAKGAEVAGRLCLGILAGASLETMLVTPLALIARTT